MANSPDTRCAAVREDQPVLRDDLHCRQVRKRDHLYCQFECYKPDNSEWIVPHLKYDAEISKVFAILSPPKCLGRKTVILWAGKRDTLGRG